MEEAAKAHHNTTQKQAQSKIGFWLASWLALAMATKNVLIHLIQDTLSGVAPEPPIGVRLLLLPIGGSGATPKKVSLIR